MRFMILRRADEETEAGIVPGPERLAAMREYTDEMTTAGVLLQCAGLYSSSTGIRVKFTSGRPSVTDGPFAETKEVIAGLIMLQVRSKAEALDWVKRWPPLDGDVELEIRQVFDAEAFGPALTDELRNQEEQLRAQ